jgi:hypothetical protein
MKYGKSTVFILANIFMYYFELKMQQFDLFPRVWVRYVDDVVAVVKSRKVKSLFEVLNAQHPTINDGGRNRWNFTISGCFSKKD